MTETKKETKEIIVKVRSKKYQEVKAKVDKNRLYSIDEAISLAKTTSYSKFDGTLELHATVKKESFTVNVNLPFSSGKQKRIAIADDAVLDDLKSGKINFDVLLATAEMMPKLVPYAKVLGPKGLMPNPKNGTLIKDKKAAEKFGGNTTTIKTEKKAPLVHTTFGKVSQKEEELRANLEAILKAIGPKQVERAIVKASMGPSIKLSVS